MTTQHIGDEDELVTEQSAEEDSPHTAEPAENPETEETTENEQPEPAQTPQEMDRSLPAPTVFNINATDLYSEWKHWVSAFEIYSIASDLKEGRRDSESHYAALPWPRSTTHFQYAPW